MTALAPEDFPQTWQHPLPSDLISILKSLELSPPVWNHRRRRSDVVVEQEAIFSRRKAEILRYVSSIISSPLAWIDDEDQKEEIWTLAGKRMTERCGRTAMGEVIRRWPLSGGGGDGVGCEPFELIIREPALTGDSLGFKTWGSSYVLAQELPKLASTSLFRLFDETLGQPVPDVVELGSGTGLLGIAAAALWGIPVHLSDLPVIVPNLDRNAEENASLVESRGGSLKVGALTWGGVGDDEVDQSLFGKCNQFQIVLVADPLYDDNHPALLASAISQHLAFGSEARAVVMVPQRDETTKQLRDTFKQAMLDLDTPLFCDEENDFAGQDDWGEEDDEDGGHVRCWLGIFSRGGSPLVTVDD